MRNPNETLGNSVRITLQMVGKDDQTFVFDHEPSLKEVLRMATLPETSEAWCGGEKAELNYTFEDGEIITVMGKKITQG